jgi:uncharacterized OB-fold protein
MVDNMDKETEKKVYQDIGNECGRKDHDKHVICLQCYDKQKAENKRLREALVIISEERVGMPKEIAKKALKKEG